MCLKVIYSKFSPTQVQQYIDLDVFLMHNKCVAAVREVYGTFNA